MELDIKFFCDDVKSGEDIFLVFVDVIDCEVILVDDVFYIGCIICAVIDNIVGYGCFVCVSLVVLVDCGYRELLICLDYVGKNILISCFEEIIVEMVEFDG